MKRFLVIVLLIAAGMFITNPKEEAFFQKALREEAGMGDKWFTEAKHAAMDVAFEYENYYVAGVLRSELDDEIIYVGAFNQVFKIK